MTPEITKELQNTLRIHPEHLKVYFDEQGRHYFDVFKLAAEHFESKRDASGKKVPIKNKEINLYGSGLYSHSEVIDSVYNVDQKTESIANGKPDTLIVLTLTRSEVLGTKVKYEGKGIVAEFANASDLEKSSALNSLGITPEILEKLRSLGAIPASKEAEIKK